MGRFWIGYWWDVVGMCTNSSGPWEDGHIVKWHENGQSLSWAGNASACQITFCQITFCQILAPCHLDPQCFKCESLNGMEHCKTRKMSDTKWCHAWVLWSAKESGLIVSSNLGDWMRSHRNAVDFQWNDKWEWGRVKMSRGLSSFLRVQGASSVICDLLGCGACGMSHTSATVCGRTSVTQASQKHAWDKHPEVEHKAKEEPQAMKKQEGPVHQSERKQATWPPLWFVCNAGKTCHPRLVPCHCHATENQHAHLRPAWCDKHHWTFHLELQSLGKKCHCRHWPIARNDPEDKMPFSHQFSMSEAFDTRCHPIHAVIIVTSATIIAALQKAVTMSALILKRDNNVHHKIATPPCLSESDPQIKWHWNQCYKL